MSTFFGQRPSQLIAIASLAVIPLAAFPAPKDRITTPIEGSRSITLRGNIPHQIQLMNDQGAVDPSTKISGMKLMLKKTATQQADLEQLLEEQRDPKSPSYHKWLTPEEFGERFGVTAGDLAKLTAWLGTQGMSVQQVARARNWITFDGSATAVESTFHTALHHYGNGSESHIANATEPSLPAMLGGIVGSIRGLDDFHPGPQHTRKTVPKYNSSGYHYLAPDDMATIYDITRLYAAGIDGTGQKLAIVGQTDFVMSDVATFRSMFDLSVNNPTVVLTGPDPGINGDETEAILDVEWSGAIARNAQIIFVNSTDVFTSVLYEIDNDLAPVMSMSYGMCELWTGTSIQQWAQQANAEGITWMNSSGDSGAASCDSDGSTVASNGLAVLSPADVPEITAVGGSEFNEGASGWSSQNGPTGSSATGYLPEMAWNDSGYGYGLDSGGGGVSVKFSKPWWQTGPGVPSDGARDLPDLSLTASADHDGYLIYEGGLGSVGGTSASSPSFAGIVTLINQYLVNQGTQSTPGLGNINPNLYSLAQNSSGVFHDITVGNNMVPCQSGTTGCSTGSYGYQAGPGYDMATGLGSVDAYNLVTNWSSAASLAGTTTTLMANPVTVAQTGSVQLTVTVNPVSGATAPSGNVTFTINGNSIASSAVSTTSGTSATATVTVSAGSLAIGSNNITATFVPAGTFSSSSGSATVSVTATPVATTASVSATPSTITQNASTQVTAAIRPASGNSAVTGSVTFTVGSKTLGTVAVASSGSVATLSVPGSSLSLGANTIAASFVGTGAFLNSNGSTTVTVTPAAVSTVTALTANPTSIASNGISQLTAIVTATTGSAAPTGTVTFKVGSTTLGSATLAASGTTAIAAFSLSGASLAKGANSITAAYTASGTFLGSTSVATTVTTTAALPGTATSITASPVSITASASTVLTVTVKPASGTVAPTGSVTFAAGGISLGTGLLKASGSSASTTLTVKGTSLMGGANPITATYTGSSTFASSSGTVTVTLPSTTVATNTSLTASPASMAKTGTTQLVATVKPATGSTTPGGTVNFTNGTAALGSVSLVAGSATLSLPGTNLPFGADSITATYSGSSQFLSSTGSTTLTITGGPVQTSLTAVASPASIASTATTQVTVTLTPASGTTPPTGSVTFALGSKSLGTAALTASGSKATAVLSISGSSLATGANTITATYAGTSAFGSAVGSLTVTVTSAAASKVIVTLAKATSAQQGFTFTISLQETAGVATSVTGFTMGGTNFSSEIASVFGSATLPANGKLTGEITVQWSPMPNPLVLVFTGADASGQQWSQTASIATK